MSLNRVIKYHILIIHPFIEKSQSLDEEKSENIEKHLSAFESEKVEVL